MWDKIVSHQESPNCISDVRDGQLYQNLKRKAGNKEFVTMTFNTDGVALFKSSREDLWPMYIALNEVPPVERYIFKLFYL